MNNMTYADAAKLLNVQLPEDLVASAEVPVLTGPQRQGDLSVWPQRSSAAVGELVTKEVPVVKGENGGNTHALLAHHGEVRFRFVDNGSTDVGVLDVAEGAVAYLVHPEHVANGFGPGAYVIRRQEEKAETMRVVAD